MTPAATAVAALDFAVLCDDPPTLEWLRTLLVDLGNGAGILDGDLEAPAATRARKVALVVRDPVELAAAQDGAASDYLATITERLHDLGERALVLASAELPDQLAALLHHLGVPEPDTTPPPPQAPVPLTPPRRARLFATIRDGVEELERVTGRTFRSWRFGSSQTSHAQPPRTQDAAELSRQLVYVGRRRDLEPRPGFCTLTDWDVLPIQIVPLLNHAERLELLDPASFPLDAMRASDWDIPLAVELPREWTPQLSEQVLGDPLLRRLTPFDVVAAADEQVREELRRIYSWPRSMLAPRLVARRAGAAAPTREAKASYRKQGAALRRRLAAASATVAPGERLSVLLLARRARLWAALLPLADTDLTGIDLDPALCARAARDFPEWTFQAELPIPDAEPETVHLALAVNSLCDYSVQERRERLAALVRALRVGGSLIVFDRFLNGRTARLIGAPRPSQLMSELLEISGRHLVLSHAETLRLPAEDMTSVALLSFTKIGHPQRP